MLRLFRAGGRRRPELLGLFRRGAGFAIAVLAAVPVDHHRPTVALLARLRVVVRMLLLLLHGSFRTQLVANNSTVDYR